MHYIQNNWFFTNWTWVLVICLFGLAVIAYINNRNILLKKSLIALSTTFVIALVFSFSGPQIQFKPITDSMMQSMSDKNNQVESPSLLTQVFSFVIDIAKDKLSD